MNLSKSIPVPKNGSYFGCGRGTKGTCTVCSTWGLSPRPTRMTSPLGSTTTWLCPSLALQGPTRPPSPATGDGTPILQLRIRTTADHLLCTQSRQEAALAQGTTPHPVLGDLHWARVKPGCSGLDETGDNRGPPGRWEEGTGGTGECRLLPGAGLRPSPLPTVVLSL